MMFRGTEKYSGEEYDKKQESIGAFNNAFTSRDHTVYHVTFPSAHLETIVEMESERLHSLQLTQSHFDKEREVVKEERRLRVDNDPNDFFDPLMDLIFPSHPYGRSIIGSMKDLDNSTLNDCQNFYNMYYSPNNIILVLTGDFEIRNAKKLIQKNYEHLKVSEKLNERYAFKREDFQTQPRQVTLKRNIQAPTLAIGYRVPKLGSEESYALEILSHIFSGGESGRLYQLLVSQTNTALSIGSYYYGLKNEGVFMIYATLAPRAKLKTAKALIQGEINRILDTEVGEEELLKSKRAIMHDYVTSMKTIQKKGRILGAYESLFGDYSYYLKDLEHYQNVTSQNIKTVSSRFFIPQGISRVELIPVK